VHIKLSPHRCDEVLTVEKSGDVLTINGIAYDFSQLPEGASIPASAVDCNFLVGEITRVEGELELCLILPHGANPTTEQAWPEPITVIADGPILLPQNKEVVL
jgi:hypothetical protein